LTGSALRLDVNSVDGVLSFQLRAGFSIGSIQTGNNEAGEIVRMVMYGISMPIHCFQAFHSMIG
jgi:hypothetical protein